jgi:thiamine-phosphate pyrophosphorylase
VTLAERRNRLAHARLYGIVDFGYVAESDVARVTAALLDGGADVIQLRAKGIALEVIRKAGEIIQPFCKAAKIPFILNDYPEMAVELGADGVHIGQDDGAIIKVRKLVGEEMLIGRSTHSFPQAKQALADGADYIGFGPLYPTPTKEGRPAIGLEEVSRMEEEVGVYLPAFCIGGIKPSNLAEVIASGARRCVIVSHLLRAPDISAETRTAKSAIPAP